MVKKIYKKYRINGIPSQKKILFMSFNHQLPIRNVMPIWLMPCLELIVTNMHSSPCLWWCRERDHIIHLFQATVLHCTWQDQTTMVAIGFLTNIIPYKLCIIAYRTTFGFLFSKNHLLNISLSCSVEET